MLLVDDLHLLLILLQELALKLLNLLIDLRPLVLQGLVDRLYGFLFVALFELSDEVIDRRLKWVKNSTRRRLNLSGRILVNQVAGSRCLRFVELCSFLALLTLRRLLLDILRVNFLKVVRVLRLQVVRNLGAFPHGLSDNELLLWFLLSVLALFPVVLALALNFRLSSVVDCVSLFVFVLIDH